VDAMPIRIDFRSRRAYVTSEKEGDDIRFVPCDSPATKELLRRTQATHGGSPESRAALIKYRSGDYEVSALKEAQLETHDAFIVCRDFLAASTESEVLEFLNKYGKFWPIQTILLRTFRRWQDYARLMSPSDPQDIDPNDQDAHHAWYALHGITNTFFPIDDEMPGPSFEKAFVDRYEELNPNAANMFANAEFAARERDARTRRELPQAFWESPAGTLSIILGPTEKTQLLIAIEHLDHWNRGAAAVATRLRQATEPGERLTLSKALDEIHQRVENAKIALQAAEVPLNPQARNAVIRRSTSGRSRILDDDLMPVLRIAPRNSLEAIAATFVALRLPRVGVRVCRHCKKRYTVDSLHGTTYCSGSCHNAATTKSTRHWKAEKSKLTNKPRVPRKTEVYLKLQTAIRDSVTKPSK
jgi:hypothetical protein